MATASKRIKLARRPLPAELLSEVHKFLPIEQQVDLIVRVQSRVIVLNNGPRVRRTLQFIRECLRNCVAQHHGSENWDAYALDEQNQSRNAFRLSGQWNQSQKWKWEAVYGALIRFGAAFTPIRHFQLWYNCTFHEVPANLFVDLLFKLANSRRNHSMQTVEISEKGNKLPRFFDPHILNKSAYFEGIYTLFDTFMLKSPRNGQSVQIIDARMDANEGNLTLFILKPIANELLKIEYQIGKWRENVLFIRYKEIPNFNKAVQYYVVPKYPFEYLEQPAGNVKSKFSIKWDNKWDIFLRRGSQLTKFRHFQIDEGKSLYGCPPFYEEELIHYMAKTSHPEHMLETIELKIKTVIGWSHEIDKPTLLPTIWTFCQNGVPTGGQTLVHEKREYKILQCTVKERRIEIVGYHKLKRNVCWMQFTLANAPTNGEYVFDMEMEFTEEEVERDKTIGIKIRRRRKMQNEQKTEAEAAAKMAKNKLIGIKIRRRQKMQNVSKAEEAECNSGNGEDGEATKNF